jgi:hypothetical protein
VKAALLALLCIAILGCVRTSGMNHTRTVLDVAASVIYSLDAQLAVKFSAAAKQCERETATGPMRDFAYCLKPWYKVQAAMALARRTTLAAARGLDGVEGNADGNPGRLLGCMAAAIGELLRAAEAVGIRPDSVPGRAWAQYSGTISQLCLMSQPGAMVGSGSSEE